MISPRGGTSADGSRPGVWTKKTGWPPTILTARPTPSSDFTVWTYFVGSGLSPRPKSSSRNENSSSPSSSGDFRGTSLVPQAIDLPSFDHASARTDDPAPASRCSSLASLGSLASLASSTLHTIASWWLPPHETTFLPSADTSIEN